MGLLTSTSRFHVNKSRSSQSMLSQVTSADDAWRHMWKNYNRKLLDACIPHDAAEQIFFIWKARKCRLIATLHTKRRFLQLTQSHHPIKIYLYVTDSAAIISKHQTSKISSNPACDQLDQKSLPQQDIVSPSLTNFFSDLSMQAHTCANHWTCTTLSYWPDLVTQNRYRYSNFENPHEVIVTLHQTHARINRTSLQTSSISIFKCLGSRRPFKASFSHIFSPY